MQHGLDTPRHREVRLEGSKGMSRRLRTMNNILEEQAPRQRGGNRVGHVRACRVVSGDHGKHEGTHRGEGNHDATLTNQTATRGLLTSVEKMREEKRQEQERVIGRQGVGRVKNLCPGGGQKHFFGIKGLGSQSVVRNCWGHMGMKSCCQFEGDTRACGTNSEVRGDAEDDPSRRRCWEAEVKGAGGDRTRRATAEGHTSVLSKPRGAVGCIHRTEGDPKHEGNEGLGDLCEGGKFAQKEFSHFF